MGLKATLTLGVFVVTCTALAWADDDLGGPGESCRARSDCQHGLKCISNVCVAPQAAATTSASTVPLTPPPPPPPRPPPTGTIEEPSAPIIVIEAPPTASTSAKPEPPPPPPPPPRPPPVRVHRIRVVPPRPRASPVRPFIGATVGFGFLNGGYSFSEGTLWGSGADGSVLLAVRGGVRIARHELALEIAPFTDFWDLVVANGPAFEANASYAYLAPLATFRHVKLVWPFRVGAGVLAGAENTNSDVFFEVRADFIGLEIDPTQHLAIELHAPSIRYAVTNGHVRGVAVEGVTTHYLSFFFGSSVSYVF